MNCAEMWKRWVKEISTLRWSDCLQQAVGRARPYGQQMTVFAYRFMCLTTTDANVIEDVTGKSIVRTEGTGKRICTPMMGELP